MVLIIGGAFQGKLEYALNNFDIDIDDVADGEKVSLRELANFKAINKLHLLVKRYSNFGIENLEFMEVIIADEIGLGIAPIDKADRLWRELSGRLLCEVAKRADCVVRINCGLPILIKGKVL